MKPHNEVQDWHERLRELYLTESPDENGYYTQSTTFTWGTFEFVGKGKEQRNFYLTTQDAMEDFISQTILKENKKLLESLLSQWPAETGSGDAPADNAVGSDNRAFGRNHALRTTKALIEKALSDLK